jgi:hypothetical protein
MDSLLPAELAHCAQQEAEPLPLGHYGRLLASQKLVGLDRSDAAVSALWGSTSKEQKPAYLSAVRSDTGTPFLHAVYRQSRTPQLHSPVSSGESLIGVLVPFPQASSNSRKLLTRLWLPSLTESRSPSAV